MSRDPFRLQRAKSSKLNPTTSRSVGNVHYLNSSSQNDPALMINQIISTKPECDCKNTVIQKDKEIRELQKKLKLDSENYEKIINQLKKEIKKLNLNLEEAKSSHKEEVDKLKSDKNSIQQVCDKQKIDINSFEAKILEQKKEVEFLKEKHELDLKKVEKSHEIAMMKLSVDKDKEVADRDAKINVMKSRMAEIIGKNSSERQKQLEELKKELIGAAEEARGLQSKLKVMEKKECKNCEKLSAKLEAKVLELRLKEKTLIDMQNIGKKMQVQLNQQDVILQKFEEKDKRDDFLFKY